MTPARRPHDGPGMARLVTAIVVLGVAITFHFLALDAVGLVLVVGVVILLVREASSGAPSMSLERLARLALSFQVTLGAIATVRELWGSPPLVLAVAGVATAALWAAGRRLLDGDDPPSGARWALLGAVALLIACWLTVPARIDVFVFQDVAAERLTDGVDPYLYGYPNFYSAAETARIYGPGLSVDGQLQAGFPYPPLSLMLSTMGWLLGDPRLAHGLAVLATVGLLLVMVPRTWSSHVAAVLFASTPMLMHVVRQSWTEPFVIVLLVLTLWTMRRGWVGAAVVMGLLVAVKQYAVVFLPVMLWLSPLLDARRRRKAALVAVGTAVAVTVPLALWHPPEFVFSVGVWQFVQPFRTDAMSVPSVLSGVIGIPPPWLQLVLTLGATGTAIWWSLRRLTPNWASVAVGVAVTMLGFLLFSKQAFTNYYMVALAAMCLALSLRPTPNEDQPL